MLARLRSCEVQYVKGDTMRAAIVYGDGTLKIEDVPMPEPNAYQALAKIEACSTCNSTDRKIIAGKLPFVSEYPAVLGHESVGTVVEVGAKVRNYKKGKRYFRPVAVYVGQKLGSMHSAWGAFAEYGLLTDNQAMIGDGADPASLCSFADLHQPVPEGISPEDATMMITLKEVCDNIQNFGVKPGRPFAVLGCGAVGTCFITFAKLLGAYPVVAVDRVDAALDRSKKFGADVTINSTDIDLKEALIEATKGGPEAIVDAVGNSALLASMLPALVPDGRLHIYGIDPSTQIKLDVFTGRGGWSLVLNTQDERRTHEQVCGYVRMGAVRLADFYNCVVPLEELGNGIEALNSGQAFKVVAKMGA